MTASSQSRAALDRALVAVDRAVFERYIAGSRFHLNAAETEWAWAGWQIRGLFEREEALLARAGEHHAHA